MKSFCLELHSLSTLSRVHCTKELYKTFTQDRDFSEARLVFTTQTRLGNSVAEDCAEPA